MSLSWSLSRLVTLVVVATTTLGAVPTAHGCAGARFRVASSAQARDAANDASNVEERAERNPASASVTSVRDATADTQSRDSSGGADFGGKRLFTAEQAFKGHGVYARHCVRCHGARLQGTVGPTLKGPGFASQDMEFTVGAMFAVMVRRMPADRPGSLTDKQYAQVMAFILQENGYPAGDMPLTYDQARKTKVPLIGEE